MPSDGAGHMEWNAARDNDVRVCVVSEQRDPLQACGSSARVGVTRRTAPGGVAEREAMQRRGAPAAIVGRIAIRSLARLYPCFFFFFSC